MEAKNKKTTAKGGFSCLARPERFELPTNWFEASYSIQLSYGRGFRVGSDWLICFAINGDGERQRIRPLSL